MNRRDVEALGFNGYVRLKAMARGCPDVPAMPGVYMVLRESAEEVSFLERSIGGRFKGKDPTVATPSLRAKWVERTDVLYIGRASSLRRRLDQYARFGRGEPVGHWGGRYVWQLAGHEGLIVGWRVDDDPIASEIDLIDQFVTANGALPFANINRPRGRRL